MTAAENAVREEIRERGPMTFARFMECALYGPGVGYYEQPGRILGRRGDFYTSVSVGPMFGFLLAARIAEAARTWPVLDLIESGAHDGRLAEDILTALREHHPEVSAKMRYHLLEPSPVREALQRQRLASWEGVVTWHRSWSDDTMPAEGVLVANELLDAFPVHRYGWNATSRSWCEWGVTLGADGLEWCALPPDPGFSVPGGEALESVIPDGFVVERSPAAIAWWREAARRLTRGWMLTFDYGFDDGRILRPERPRGTLRAYWQHQVNDDLLSRPGEQDLTAHVDFAELRAAAEQEGWSTELSEAQGRCLGRWAVAVLAQGGPAADWIQKRASQLQTLTHPTHLGQAFRVLMQRRNVT